MNGIINSMPGSDFDIDFMFRPHYRNSSPMPCSDKAIGKEGRMVDDVRSEYLRCKPKLYDAAIARIDKAIYAAARAGKTCYRFQCEPDIAERLTNRYRSEGFTCYIIQNTGEHVAYLDIGW